VRMATLAAVHRRAGQRANLRSSDVCIRPQADGCEGPLADPTPWFSVMFPPGMSKNRRKDYEPPNECPDKTEKCAGGNDPQHPHRSEFVILIRGHRKYCGHWEREHDKDKDYMVP